MIEARVIKQFLLIFFNVDMKILLLSRPIADDDCNYIEQFYRRILSQFSVN